MPFLDRLRGRGQSMEPDRRTRAMAGAGDAVEATQPTSPRLTRCAMDGDLLDREPLLGGRPGRRPSPLERLLLRY